jgi:hypothetical protein
MMTLMRNGRDRRLGKPGMGHATLERVFLFGTRSADHIRASGHSGCVVMGTSSPFENRPDTWLHPNASRKRQILLAPRAPSIHGPSVWTGRALQAESDDLEKLVLRICIRPIHGAFELLAIMDIRACSISFASRPRRPYGPPDHERAGETFLHLLISTRRPRWES